MVGNYTPRRMPELTNSPPAHHRVLAMRLPFARSCFLIAVGLTQLLEHLDLGDMRRSTEYPLLFEGCPDQATVEAAAASATNSMVGFMTTKSSGHATVSFVWAIHPFMFVDLQTFDILGVVGAMSREAACLHCGQTAHRGFGPIKQF